MAYVQTGLESFLEDPPRWVFGNRLGLLCNPASVDRHLRHARDLIHRKFPDHLKALYAPQHGFYAEKQDNMIESEDTIDPALNIPIYSLYGKTRIPDKKMLEPIDILLIDLQDVGTRVYTFIYTVSYCMEAAKKFGKKILILDRPNPVNGSMTEGNCLSPDYASFVGRFPIPMRHGLTIGELSLFFNNEYDIGCELDVIPMKGWNRKMYFHDTGLPWVPPSPNLPTPVSTMVYPGQVIWEGTNVSEGRGTTQPFEIFGAPFIDTEQILSSLGGNKLPGATLREIVFEPTSNKWKGDPCRGFQIHVTDLDEFKPYITTCQLLQEVIKHHPDHFQWKPPPYEYEHRKQPIDLIIGDKEIRLRLASLEDVNKIAESWQDDLESFIEQNQKYCMYISKEASDS